MLVEVIRLWVYAELVRFQVLRDESGELLPHPLKLLSHHFDSPLEPLHIAQLHREPQVLPQRRVLSPTQNPCHCPIV